VTLKQRGDILVLYDQKSGTYTGILNNTRLVNALYNIPLRLDATLLISAVRPNRENIKAPKKKSHAAQAAREYSIRIVLYGVQDQKDTIGDLLSEAGFFLQHPSVAEIIPGVEYNNPHYLLRPGAEMPKLKDLDTTEDGSAPTQLADEIRKNRFLRIFESAVGDGETVTMANTLPSPRLRSTLMK
jgi:hypothetical protein